MSVTKQILERLRKDINTFGAATITHNELCIVEARFEALSAKLAEAERERDAEKATCDIMTDACRQAQARAAVAEARVAELEKALKWYADLPKEWTIKADSLSYGDLHLLGEKARAALATKGPKP
jgi:hypothetical protein